MSNKPKTDFEVTFTLDELELLATATSNHARNLYSVANRVGPTARHGREERILRAGIANQLAERMIEEFHKARGPLPGLKARK